MGINEMIQQTPNPTSAVVSGTTPRSMKAEVTSADAGPALLGLTLNMGNTLLGLGARNQFPIDSPIERRSGSQLVASSCYIPPTPGLNFLLLLRTAGITLDLYSGQ